jgi:hypothetical protein
MEIVTIACPPGFTDPNVTENAPIWTDGVNNYQVASGPLEDYISSDPVTATPDRLNIIVGMPGLLALELMGLTVAELV